MNPASRGIESLTIHRCAGAYESTRIKGQENEREKCISEISGDVDCGVDVHRIRRRSGHAPVKPVPGPQGQQRIRHPQQSRWQKCADAVGRFRSAGHTVEDVSFPYLEYLVPTYYVLTTAEASSNLSRFSGIHYGHRTTKQADLEKTYKFSRSEGFGPEVKRRIMLGTFVLSAGYYDAYYAKAQKVRRLIREKTDEILIIFL